MRIRLPHQWRPLARVDADALPDARVRPVEPDEQARVVMYLDAQAWGEEDLGGGWVAAYRLAVENGRPIVSELRIFPGSSNDQWRPAGSWPAARLGPSATGVPTGGLTATAVRRVTIGRALRGADARLDRFRHAFPGIFDAGAPLEALDTVHPDQEESRTKRPAALDDRALARIAQAFVTSGSLSATAERFKLKESTARGRIELARRRGLLERAGRQGQRGRSRLTPAAKRLLSRSRRNR